MKTTVKKMAAGDTKPKLIKKMSAGGMTDAECAKPPGKFKKACRKVFKGKSTSKETKGGILGTLVAGALGTAGYYGYKKLKEQKKGGSVINKSVKAKAGINVKSDPPKSFTNPLTGRTRVTEGWKKIDQRKGTIPPKPSLEEKKIDVYDKKGNPVKTIQKTKFLTSKPIDNNKFINKGKRTYSYNKKVTKYNKQD